MKKISSGFTLIELLVVIAIIGLLSSVVLVSLNSARSKGRDSSRIQGLVQVRSALELYRAANGSYPITEDESVLATQLSPYIKVLPSATFAEYTPVSNGASYTYRISNMENALPTTSVFYDSAGYAKVTPPMASTGGGGTNQVTVWWDGPLSDITLNWEATDSESSCDLVFDVQEYNGWAENGRPSFYTIYNIQYTEDTIATVTCDGGPDGLGSDSVEISP